MSSSSLLVQPSSSSSLLVQPSSSSSLPVQPSIQTQAENYSMGNVSREALQKALAQGFWIPKGAGLQ